NTKYFIIENEGQVLAQPNPDTNGHAWFVDEVNVVDSANEEILALDTINTKTTAVIDKDFADLVETKSYTPHPEDSITLKSYQPNELMYTYTLKEDRLAVFSEMYYPHGWKAEVNGEELEIMRADYVLPAV